MSVLGWFLRCGFHCLLALQRDRAALRERKEKTAYKNVGRGGATLIELCPLDPIVIVIGLEFSTSTHSLLSQDIIYNMLALLKTLLTAVL